MKTSHSHGLSGCVKAYPRCLFVLWGLLFLAIQNSMAYQYHLILYDNCAFGDVSIPCSDVVNIRYDVQFAPSADPMQQRLRSGTYTINVLENGVHSGNLYFSVQDDGSVTNWVPSDDPAARVVETGGIVTEYDLSSDGNVYGGEVSGDPSDVVGSCSVSQTDIKFDQTASVL